MVSVGTIVWLASELMFFAGLFAMYFQIRALSPELWAEQTAKLNVPFAPVNALILLTSMTARTQLTLKASLDRVLTFTVR